MNEIIKRSAQKGNNLFELKKDSQIVQRIENHRVLTKLQTFRQFELQFHKIYRKEMLN